MWGDAGPIEVLVVQMVARVLPLCHLPPFARAIALLHMSGCKDIIQDSVTFGLALYLWLLYWDHLNAFYGQPLRYLYDELLDGNGTILYPELMPSSCRKDCLEGLESPCAHRHICVNHYEALMKALHLRPLCPTHGDLSKAVKRSEEGNPCDACLRHVRKCRSLESVVSGLQKDAT